MSAITQKLESTQIKTSHSPQYAAIDPLIPKQIPGFIVNRIAGFTSYDELSHTSHLLSKRFPKLPMHVLNLKNSKITDIDLIKLIEKEKDSLTHINLSNCPNITDLSLKHLVKLQNLKTLNLSGCWKITDAGAKDLSKLQNLTALNLSGCNKIADAGVKDLSNLQNLTSLNLSDCAKITDASAKALSTLQNLTALNLSGRNKIADAGVKDLSNLQNLTALHLSGCDRITDAGAKDLSKLQNLKALNLSFCGEITDAGVKDLSKLQNLTELNLSGRNKIADAGAKDLSKLQNLTELNLSGCWRITDAGAKDLSKLQNLTTLNLHGCGKITDAGVKDLSKLQNLTALDLSFSGEITDAGAKDLSKLQNLTELNLAYCNKITDAGVKDLSKLQNLTALDLSYFSKITDAGAKNLLNLQHLTKLSLHVMGISITNVKELEIFMQIFAEKTALNEFINEKSKKIGTLKCEPLFQDVHAMNCSALPTGYQITSNSLYLLEEKNMDSFLLQNPDAQKNISTFLIQKKPEFLKKAATDLIEWFNSNKLFKVASTDDNIVLAEELLIMHAIGKLSAMKRFILTHEMGHAHDWDGRKSLGDFDPLELDFIKPHQFGEARADLTAAREENAHDVGIAYFEWRSVIAGQPYEHDPHPTDKNRAKALQIDHDKILKKMTISTS